MSEPLATPPLSLTAHPAWKALQAHFQKVRTLHLRQLFADDPQRGERFTAEACGLYLDYSKNRITDETLQLLVQLAEACNLREHIEAMFTGQKINVTEQRAVLHTALRAPKEERIIVNGIDIVPEVHAVLDEMADFTHKIHHGEWLGFTGLPIRNVINIG